MANKSNGDSHLDIKAIGHALNKVRKLLYTLRNCKWDTEEKDCQLINNTENS